MIVRVGIDNGADGGIVALGGDFRVLLQEAPPFVNVGVKRARRATGETYTGTKRVMDEAAVVDLARRVRALGNDVFAVIEFAQVMPREGAVTSFHYGASVAAYRVAFLAAGVPFEVIRPQTWQAAVLRGIEGQDTKAKAIVKAGRAVTGLELVGDKARRGGRADAACMALYALHLRPGLGGTPALVAPPVEARRRLPPPSTPMTAPPPPPPPPRRPGGPGLPPPPPRRG